MHRIPECFVWLLAIVASPLTWILLAVICLGGFIYTVRKLRKKDQHD